jgi:NADPH:quinone reductase-like Zn-dependent oxidoreductase
MLDDVHPQPSLCVVRATWRLIAARFAGVNWADVAQRAGHYPPPPGSPPDIPHDGGHVQPSSGSDPAR